MPDNTTENATLEVDGAQFTTVTEGLATILVPQGAKVGEDGGEVQQVFYNPIQQYNRDLSVLAIKAYGEEALEKRKSRKQAKDAKHGKKRKRGDENGTKSEETKRPGSEPAQPAQAEKQPGSEPAQAEQQSESQSGAAGQNAGNTTKPSFKVLDALSASGLRALRYARELPFVTSITANDLSASAAKSIKQNVKHNDVEDIVSVTNGDALAVMYRTIADSLANGEANKPWNKTSKTSKFDVIDLDPYGTAAPFFDAAVQAVRDDGGLLCITCTDSAVWAGHAYCEKSFSLYGGTPIHGMHSHEAGLRLIINAVATSAARYGLTIEPQLSLSIDFYTKVFIKVTKSPQAVKFLGSKTMVVYSCDSGCSAWETQYLMRAKAVPNKKGNGAFYKFGMSLGIADQVCKHCGTKMHVNGPMYGGHIHSREFIERLLKQIPEADKNVYRTLPRLEGMLQNALEELIPGPEERAPVEPRDKEYAKIDRYPFFVIPGKLGSIISCATPSDDHFRGALKHLGYVAGRSHCRPGSIKTDAPWSTIWWIMAEWIRQKAPVKTSKFKPDTAPWRLLQRLGILEQQGDAGGDDVTMAGVDAEEKEDKKASAEPPVTNEKKVLTEEDLRKTLVFNDELARLGREGKTENLVRYQMNPRENWGPLTKAKSN
ncbi:N2,N2-dimethylguanosine tRNA methyltransferase [Cordyceps fumosorosea ARSEF 2679]|uniref:tRNA (guanine(26)-N(2))-dimethyltransferase n=1 Tax=Cordyceps fumosorosea (strain ARSEF 2679) TaxID=1081104 RepID=A0A168AKN6_CORFA|nr:N2,N2-dimethylguanosine tRNA methyltransferase [Cordyceps fumosorosea ARSEF 2679]OAA68880.1 N2,N2-dimethylguanosine tRNA methyltransferase [Cordyceps fumosorosea ARSEF 2679]